MSGQDPYRPLSVPAVLAPKACGELVKKATHARIVRRPGGLGDRLGGARYERTPSKADARMLQFLRLRGVEVNLKMT